MQSTPRFLQGVFPFEGKGLDAPEGVVGTVVVDLGLVEV
jgi:hypothetical protein